MRYERGEALVRINGFAQVTPVVFGEDDAEPLIGVVTLEQLELAVDPFGWRTNPRPPTTVRKTPQDVIPAHYSVIPAKAGIQERRILPADLLAFPQNHAASIAAKSTPNRNMRNTLNISPVTSWPIVIKAMKLHE